MNQDKNALLQQLKLDKTQTNSAPPTLTKTVLFSLLLGAILGAAITYWLFPRSQIVTALKNSAVPVSRQSEVAPVSSENAVPASQTQRSNNKILDASGYITARQMATVSAKVMGLIVSVEVEEGMNVQAGQVLARVDSTQADINLQLAEARLVASQARIQRLKVELEESARSLKRITQLNDAGHFSSEAQISQAQTNMASLQAELDSALADSTVAQKNVNYQRSIVNDHTIRAPFAGVVTTKNAQAGEIVSPSSAGGGFTRTGICTIVDMNSLEIEVDVNEAYIGRVYQGQKVEAVLDAYPNWVIPASVIAVIPTADRAKATVRVRIQIDQKDEKILPDMGVKVGFLK